MLELEGRGLYASKVKRLRKMGVMCWRGPTRLVRATLPCRATKWTSAGSDGEVLLANENANALTTEADLSGKLARNS